MAEPQVVLASQSPRRAQLLAMLGIRAAVAPAALDETWRPGEEPGAHAERLAREKAQSVAVRFPDAAVIGSDTVVAVAGDVLGKPADMADARRMLLRLQGREHEVATGVAVVQGGRTWSAVERVRVRFRPFDEALAEAYVATGEPMDKAGAYGIQGFGSVLVEGIDGDYFAVMGLPVVRTLALLQQAGLHYTFRGLVRQGADA
jgi:septum formation protein